MTESKEITSPFEPVWQHMFGWQHDYRTILVDLVTYDWRPEILEKQLPSTFNTNIWKIVSGYTTDLQSPLCFELWKYKDDFTGGSTYCNWYGPLTYGTCWFRGCKVWFGPRCGIIQSFPLVVSDEDDGENDDSSEILGEYFADEFRDIHKQRSTPDQMSIEEYYDTTKRIPIRCDNPLAVMEKLGGDSSRCNRGCDCDKLTTAYGLIGDFCNQHNIGVDTSLCCASKRPRGMRTPYEGDTSPSVIAVFDTDRLKNELALVEELGKRNHSVSFEWV